MCLILIPLLSLRVRQGSVTWALADQAVGLPTGRGVLDALFLGEERFKLQLILGGNEVPSQNQERKANRVLTPAHLLSRT